MQRKTGSKKKATTKTKKAATTRAKAPPSESAAKTSTRKSPGRKAGTQPTAAAKTVAETESVAAPTISAEDRHRMIEEAAYFRSLEQGPYVDPSENWAAAEAAIDAMLSDHGQRTRA